MTAYQETAPGLAVVSTGEYVPAIDATEATTRQIEAWLGTMRVAVQDMTTIDELNQAEAMLTAVSKRLKQLDQDAAEAERVRIETFARIGELLGEPDPTHEFYGNQHTDGVLRRDKTPDTTYQRNYKARVIHRHWDLVAPILPEMKRPSVNAVLKEIKRMTAKLDPPEGGEAVITHARWEDWLPSQEPCDLLLTDPPYATDVSDIASFAAHWLPFALGKVKSTGRAYVCIGAYPHELEAYLSVPSPSSLVLSQVLVWTYRNTLGPSPKLDYKLNWQAILYYRGVDAPALNAPEMVEQFSVADISAPDGRHGNRWHPWQKPDALAERFIRHATQPGAVVLDPFAGTGTHVLAAARLGRRGYGCEIDPVTVEMARQRGCSDAN